MNGKIMAALAAALIAVLLAPQAEARPRHHHYSRVVYTYNGQVVGGRPSGCPYAFCGCEASRYIFGKIIPDLNLAANWMRKFPRTYAAPGMVAARNHHVMVLMHQVSGSEWMVHDGNGGHHKIWEHVRSISGYVIVDPHGGRMASNN